MAVILHLELMRWVHGNVPVGKISITHPEGLRHNGDAAARVLLHIRSVRAHGGEGKDGAALHSNSSSSSSSSGCMLYGGAAILPRNPAAAAPKTHNCEPCHRRAYWTTLPLHSGSMVSQQSILQQLRSVSLPGIVMGWPANRPCRQRRIPPRCRWGSPPALPVPGWPARQTWREGEGCGAAEVLRLAVLGCTGLHWSPCTAALPWLPGRCTVQGGGATKAARRWHRTHLPYATSVRASSGREMRAAVAWCSRYACPVDAMWGAGDGEC